ncbi:MAG: helix-hairpin-helix domain-containing protein [Runella zeae]
MKTYLNSLGKKILLGNKIGSGGEGAVFEVSNYDNEIVAKIYHTEVSRHKQAKLHAMLKSNNESIQKIATWPIDSLHFSSKETVEGFLMPKLNNYEPIHHLYNPGHRKKNFPDKDWSFLVHVARNISSAFDVIHTNGHVIGDVNPNLIYFAKNGTVKLIDCDSFQINYNGLSFLCDVGVPHFTPPELQTITTFRGLHRTQNHDNFGLALIIFHILLMGRHPFAGIYPNNADITLEQAIQHLYYAFGNKKTNQGTQPPPNCVTPEILPNEIIDLFNAAFSLESSQSEIRPTARQWTQKLDILRAQLKACTTDPSHKYYHSLPQCPWCVKEKTSGIYFFLPSTTLLNTFDLTRIWIRINSVDNLGPAPTIDFSLIKAIPQPIPYKIKIAKFIKFTSILTLVLLGFSIGQSEAVISILISLFIYFVIQVDIKEKQLRSNKVKDCKQKWNEALKEWQSNAGNSRYLTKYKEFTNLKTEYENLNQLLQIEKEKIRHKTRENQLKKFLESHYIENYNISSIASSRKATLSSFGIDTAAEIDEKIIINIPGFGPKFTNELVKWRKNIEKRFVFDPSKGMDLSEVKVLEQKFIHRRKQIENYLLNGPEELTKINSSILKERESFDKIYEIAKMLVQAEADLSIFQ